MPDEHEQATRTFPAQRGNSYRDTWCGELRGDRVGARGARRRLGSPPPRPRRPDLHRPARPHRARPARLRSRRAQRRAVRRRPQAAGRGRAQRRRDGRRARRRARQPGAADRGLGAPGRRLRAARRRRDAAVRDRELVRGGGGGLAPAPPLPRPAPRDDARGDRAALPARRRDARVPRRRGLPRDRDAGPDPLHAGGRPRLPRSGPHPPGLVLRAAAVAAAVQAAADGLRLRALLPDRPLLPGRGSARRPPARLHPARHRDVVRRGRGRARRQRAADRPRARRRRDRGRAAAAADPLRRGDRALRHRQARHALRPGAGRRSARRWPRPSSRSSAARSTAAASSRASTPAGASCRARSSTG